MFICTGLANLPADDGGKCGAVFLNRRRRSSPRDSVKRRVVPKSAASIRPPVTSLDNLRDFGGLISSSGDLELLQPGELQMTSFGLDLHLQGRNQDEHFLVGGVGSCFGQSL